MALPKLILAVTSQPYDLRPYVPRTHLNVIFRETSLYTNCILSNECLHQNYACIPCFFHAIYIQSVAATKIYAPNKPGRLAGCKTRNSSLCYIINCKLTSSFLRFRPQNTVVTCLITSNYEKKKYWRKTICETKK
jgi:hypothetical protein